jgi:hypothetical protein
MTSQLLHVIENNGDNLLEEVNLLLKEGEDPNAGDKGKSPLLTASTNCRFDVVKLLLSKGADESQLGWTPLFKCVFFDTTSDLEALLKTLTETTKPLELEHHDHDKRTPLALAILLGETTKADLLECGSQSAFDSLFLSPIIDKIVVLEEPEILNYVINLGYDRDSEKRYRAMCLAAITHDCYKSAQFILDTTLEYADNFNGERADLKKSFLGYEISTEIHISEPDYKRDQTPVYGTQNPELANKPFWCAMAKCRTDAFYAEKLLRERHGYTLQSPNDPVWGNDRAGQTLNVLPGGSFVEIGGLSDPLDPYDRDHHCYNDVIVHNGKGHCDIYIYPKDVFPQTYYHSATLVGSQIYIIGNAWGKNEPKKYVGYTLVYVLNLDNFQINKVETSGNMPGWIFKHKAAFDGSNTIILSQGTIFTGVTDTGVTYKNTNRTKKDFHYKENTVRYSLCLKTMRWNQLD